jgi:hypothetical protein
VFTQLAQGVAAECGTEITAPRRQTKCLVGVEAARFPERIDDAQIRAGLAVICVAPLNQRGQTVFGHRRHAVTVEAQHAVTAAPMCAAERASALIESRGALHVHWRAVAVFKIEGQRDARRWVAVGARPLIAWESATGE